MHHLRSDRKVAIERLRRWVAIAEEHIDGAD
jgi:hypothetical protein